MAAIYSDIVRPLHLVHDFIYSYCFHLPPRKISNNLPSLSFVHCLRTTPWMKMTLITILFLIFLPHLTRHSETSDFAPARYWRRPRATQWTRLLPDAAGESISVRQGWWIVRQWLLPPSHCICTFIWKHNVIHKKMEVHNLLHCRQRTNEPRPQVTCTENLVKFGHVAFAICELTDRQRGWSRYFAPLPRVKKSVGSGVDPSVQAVRPQSSTRR